jgi:hypothetical protein
MSNDNRPVKIGIKDLCNKFLTFSGILAVEIISILGYQSLNDDLRDQSISKWLISHIVFTGIQLYLYLRLMVIICINYGKIMATSEWEGKIGETLLLCGDG